MIETSIKLRMGQHDAHYAGNLVDGAKMLNLFGDVATELLVRYDGDEGLFRAYDSVEFLAPVYAGDFIEAKGRIVSVGKTSRKMEFEAWKYISPNTKAGETAADLLEEPILVCKASGTCVTPKECQRVEH
ncbi:3-aminobutyryl-CoA ammonia lyase [bacterium]|nr:3-aminobutyryl-CoA ammonia lyase [bacterium]